MNIKFSSKKTKKIPNEKFLLEAITKYIESSNFPKKLVLKKIKNAIDLNKSLIEKFKQKENELIKYENTIKTKIKTISNNNKEEINRLLKTV